MKKRVLSLLLILSLLIGLPGMTFGGAADIKGYTRINPMGLNGEMKLKDLKTPNGTWKNASIKVSEVQIDNVGYKKYNSSQNTSYSDSTLRTMDAVKVKVTYTFSGYSGNQNSLIKDNLLAKEICVVKSNGRYITNSQINSGFANALYNKVEKYSAGGKVYKGEWYSKKIKDLNFSKPVTMTGYVYLGFDKGKAEGATVNFTLYPQNDPNKSEVYFVFTNKMLASRVKNTGSYIYGDNEVGVIKADFEMKEYYDTESNTEENGSVLKYYRVGTEKDPILDIGMLKSTVGVGTEDEIKDYIEEAGENLADDYELEKYEDHGNYIIQGVSESYSQYINIHLINKGDHFLVISILGDINEKANVDKLWASYKANNDLSIPAKATSTTTGSFIYGTNAHGKITLPEKLYEEKISENGELAYYSKSEDCRYLLNYFNYSKEVANEVESYCREKLPTATVAKLDQGNILVYSDATNPLDCYTVMTVVKNNKLYLLTIDLIQGKLSTHKAPVIKSYLLSLGYTEAEVNAIMTDPIFK